MLTMPLSECLNNSAAIVKELVFNDKNDPIAKRLEDLGFTPGQWVKIIAVTPFQNGPIVVKIGMARFALRYTEASRILVKEYYNG